MRLALGTACGASASAVLLAAAVVGVAWAVAPGEGPVYLLLLIVASSCGVPWGWRLFGRDNAAGWVGGLLLGYAAAGAGWWIANNVLDSGTPGWALIWAITASGSWVWWVRTRARPALAPLPVWTRRHTAALLLTLCLVPAIVGRPFTNIGRVEDDGAHRYRAYFTADFVWHMAVVEELSKPTRYPINPYLAPERLHYYWAYFLVPAAMTASMPDLSAADAVALNAMGCGLLFVAMLFLLTCAVVPRRPFVSGLSVALVVLCGSAEGLAASLFLWVNGMPFELLRDVNIDALAAWAYKGLRIDNLPRALLYTAHHAAAFSLGAVALLTIGGAATAGRATILMAGVALAVAFTMNPFVGAVCAAVYGLGVLWQLRACPRSAVFRHALVSLPVAAAALWCGANETMQGAGGNLIVGWWGPATNAPVRTLLLSIFPAAAPPVVGWLCGRGDRLPIFAAAGVALSLVLMFTVSLRADPHWVGFRTGHLLFSFLPALVAWSYQRLLTAGRTGLAGAMTAGVLLAGLPTTAIDAYNAQDVDNLREGPGFRWTLALSPSQWEAVEWIRQATPRDAIVQAEPVSRGRDAWSLIPSFAGRRMAAGLPISLLHEPHYDEASALIRTMFAGDDAAQAHRIATRLGVQYVYVDADDRAHYPAVGKFDDHPDLFEAVFRNREVVIYAVR